MIYIHELIERATGITDAEKRIAHSELDLPPGQDELVRAGQVGLLCALLETYCRDNGIPYESADDLAHKYPTHAPWLFAFGELWTVTMASNPPEAD
jgi:hypothetical protein